MTGAGSTPRTQKELIRSTERRLRGQERRLVPQSLREGGRFGITIGLHVGDLNDLIYTGWYQSAGPTSSPNRPPEADALGLGSLEIQVVSLASGSVFQTARTHGSVGDPYRWEWVRDLRGAYGWSEWRVVNTPRVSFSPEINSGVSLGNGSLDGVYQVSGGRAKIEINLTIGSTTGTFSDLLFKSPIRIPATLQHTNGGGRLSGANYNLVTLASGSNLYVRAIRTHSTSGFIEQVSLTNIPNASFVSGRVIQAVFDVTL